MKAESRDIEHLYMQGFREYVLEKREKYLSEAYEESRKFLQAGMTESNLIGLHHDALINLLENSEHPPYPAVIERASVYFKEWIAPFGVTLRSYRALSVELHQKNVQLEKENLNRRQVQKELAGRNSYFHSLIENVQDIITVIDFKGIIRYASPSIERILHYRPHELIGKNAFNFILSEDVETVKHIIFDIQESPDRVQAVVFRFRHKNAGWRYLESVAKNITDSDDDPVVVMNSRDITTRKKRIEKLKDHEAKLSEAQRIANVGSWEWNLNKKPALEWSDEMCRIYGIRPETFDGLYTTFISHVHPDDRQRVENIIETALQDRKYFSFEKKIIRTDGQIRMLFCRGRVLRNKEGQTKKMVGIGRDITEQKEKERKLREYSMRLRELSGRIERAREEERIRIAREIHDKLGQMLTVLKMDISLMRGQMKEIMSGVQLDFFCDETEKILDHVNTIMESVQRITTELRPEVLEELGLIEAIEWLAEEFYKRTDLDFTLDTELQNTDFLDEEESKAVFRIFQETMNNIVRHAGASKVTITLHRIQHNLILTIRDNGIGITEEQREARSSFGIIGMRERARLLGGDVYMEGRENEGTCITVYIPLRKDN